MEPKEKQGLLSGKIRTASIFLPLKIQKMYQIIDTSTWEAVSKSLAFSSMGSETTPKAHHFHKRCRYLEKKTENAFLHREITVLQKGQKYSGIISRWAFAVPRATVCSADGLDNLRIGNDHPELERKETWFSGYMLFKWTWFPKYHLKCEQCYLKLWVYVQPSTAWVFAKQACFWVRRCEVS